MAALQVQSLVDIGSGLWPFAHNSTNALYGGWWNGKYSVASSVHSVCTPSLPSLPADLDMMQVSQGDFSCAADAPSLARCRAHFSMWCIMKVTTCTCMHSSSDRLTRPPFLRRPLC